nr:NAC domain-containing protein 83-like [Ipomoea batatas]
MEKLSFVKNGVLRLPPGFRFHPTDEELVVQYLKCKVLSCPLPASIIPEVDICKSDPWDLPGDLEQERYFFSTREVKYPNGNRSNRATSSGYWKATGLDKQIVSSKGHRQLVGMKKTLVFYKGKPPQGARTDWIMHEYRLTNAESLPNNPPQVRHIFQFSIIAKRGAKNEDENTPTLAQAQTQTQAITNNRAGGLKNNGKPVFYDFLARERTDLNLAPASSSSGSSGVTEASCNDKTDDHEESSSCCNSFTTFRTKP